MPSSPRLVLVDPSARRHVAVRQRVVSIVLGMAVAAASAVPLLLALRG